jgi:hypothetical protein
MKRNYIALLICALAAFCIAATPYGSSVEDGGDDNPIFGHWKTDGDEDDSTSYIILNFSEDEMQAVYYADGEIVKKGVVEVQYSENKVSFVDYETEYNIQNDTLHFSLNKVKYFAVRMKAEDLPKDNDDFSNVSQRSWPKKGIKWVLSWFE